MSFDTLAPHYRWMEAVLAGARLQRCRTRFVADVSASREVLIVGPGRGRFLSALLAAAPAARVTLVDSSRRMLARVERDLGAADPAARDRVALVHADIRAWEGPPAAFDLIATHFVLDCFDADGVAEVVQRVARWAAPAARWLVSDFRVPGGGWARHRAHVIHALMYAFFRASTGIEARRVTPPDADLAAAGFTLVRRELSNFGLLHADLWARPAA